MPERRWLVLTLEAPLVAFGGVTIDHVGVTREFPAASMLSGLIANALGLERTDRLRHQALQDRLVFAARRERNPVLDLITDTQNAHLHLGDRGWTTWGDPEGRFGASYGGPHRRRRDYHADASVTVVLRFEPQGEAPDLETVASAMDRPARPLFLGRKPCLPSKPLLASEASGYRFVVASTAYEALRVLPGHVVGVPLRAMWPATEGPADGPYVKAIFDVPDIRNWRTGLHGGSRQVIEGVVEPMGAAL